MAISIFYSWQSDTETASNRYFLRDCLDSSIKSVGAELEVNETIVLEQDTKGIPGIPEITKTILNKIDKCAIFVADITSIASTHQGKKVPNPNVLYELGYAIKTVGDTRIILLINQLFGAPKESLPFNIAHRRWPINYELDPKAQKNVQQIQKQNVTAELKYAIGVILKQEYMISESERVGVLEKIHKDKISIMLSDLVGSSELERVEAVFLELEEKALSGSWENVDRFFRFLKNKYFPIIGKLTVENQNMNYLDYWNKVFAKGGSFLKIRAIFNQKKHIEKIDEFRIMMNFSDATPAQSAGQYGLEFQRLKEAASNGRTEDIEKLLKFIKDEYLPFERAYSGKNSRDYRWLLERLLGKNGLYEQLKDILEKKRRQTIIS